MKWNLCCRLECNFAFVCEVCSIQRRRRIYVLIALGQRKEASASRTLSFYFLELWGFCSSCSVFLNFRFSLHIFFFNFIIIGFSVSPELLHWLACLRLLRKLARQVLSLNIYLLLSRLPLWDIINFSRRVWSAFSGSPFDCSRDNEMGLKVKRTLFRFFRKSKYII